MKVPTKAELYAQIEALTKENIRLNEQLEAEERKKWEAKKDQAFAVLYRDVPFNKSEMQFITLARSARVFITGTSSARV